MACKKTEVSEAAAVENAAVSLGVDVSEISFENLDPDELVSVDNIRTDEDDEAFRQLKASIAAVGVLEPLIVCPDSDMAGAFQVIAGHRRQLAASVLGIKTVPCVVYPKLTPAQFAGIMLSENLIREDLNPVDAARGFKRLVDSGMKQKDIAEAFGLDPAVVSRKLHMLELPQGILDLIASGDCPEVFAQVIYKYKDYPFFDGWMPVLIEGIKSGSVPNTEQLVKGWHGGLYGFLQVSKTFCEWPLDCEKCADCKNRIKIDWRDFCLDADCNERTSAELGGGNDVEPDNDYEYYEYELQGMERGRSRQINEAVRLRVIGIVREEVRDTSFAALDPVPALKYYLLGYSGIRSEGEFESSIEGLCRLAISSYVVDRISYNFTGTSEEIDTVNQRAAACGIDRVDFDPIFSECTEEWTSSHPDKVAKISEYREIVASHEAVASKDEDHVAEDSAS